MKRLVFVSLFLVWVVIGRSVTISGHVYCSGSKMPVVGAEVYFQSITDKSDTVYTDSTGFYSLNSPDTALMIGVNSDETYPNVIGNQTPKYYAAKPEFIEFKKEANDTVLDFHLEIVAYCGSPLAIYFSKKMIDTARVGSVEKQVESFLERIKTNPQISKLELVGHIKAGEDSTLRHQRAELVLGLMPEKGHSFDEISVNYVAPNKYYPRNQMSCDLQPQFEAPDYYMNPRVEFIIKEIRE